MNKKTLIFIIVVAIWCAFLFSFSLIHVSRNAKFVESGVYLADVQAAVDKPVKILSFGDMMLDRAVRKVIISNGPDYPFEKIKDLFVGYDEVVVNNEGPFTENKSLTMDVKNGPLQFTFDSSLPKELKKIGITLLGLANNHTLNFGNGGLKETVKNIEEAGLNWFGDPENQPHVYRLDKYGKKIVFIGYHEFMPGLNRLVEAISIEKKKGNFVLVYSHWGDEYEENYSSFQQRLAHSFVDAGADVVIGSHPHVVQPVEVYNDKPIFYSLGNFIFDQPAGPTSEGLALSLVLSRNYAEYKILPIKIEKKQASLMGDNDSLVIFKKIGLLDGILKVKR